MNFLSTMLTFFFLRILHIPLLIFRNIISWIRSETGLVELFYSCCSTCLLIPSPNLPKISSWAIGVKRGDINTSLPYPLPLELSFLHWPHWMSWGLWLWTCNIDAASIVVVESIFALDCVWLIEIGMAPGYDVLRIAFSLVLFCPFIFWSLNFLCNLFLFTLYNVIFPFFFFSLKIT